MDKILNLLNRTLILFSIMKLILRIELFHKNQCICTSLKTKFQKL